MYTWEKFWDIWDSVVFSDGRVYGAIRFGMLLDSKKGDRALNLKLDMKHSDSQLKDSELEIGLPTRQALNDVKKQWDAEAMLS